MDIHTKVHSSHHYYCYLFDVLCPETVAKHYLKTKKQTNKKTLQNNTEWIRKSALLLISFLRDQ